MAAWMPVHAQDFLKFHTSNVQLLSGERYELGPSQRTIITLEHANRWRYGDFFGFADVTLNNDIDVYTELAPRLSLQDVGLIEKRQTGLLQDYYLTTVLELLPEGRRRYALLQFIS